MGPKEEEGGRGALGPERGPEVSLLVHCNCLNEPDESEARKPGFA